MKYFKPKCVDVPESGTFYNNKGFLFPCCFVGDLSQKPDWEEFWDESLNVSNNESIEDIITSDTWVDFFHDIVNGIHKKKACSKYCMENSEDKILLDPHIRRVDLDND